MAYHGRSSEPNLGQFTFLRYLTQEIQRCRTPTKFVQTSISQNVVKLVGYSCIKALKRIIYNEILNLATARPTRYLI